MKSMIKMAFVAIGALAIASAASAGSASVYASGAGTYGGDWTNWVYMGSNQAPTVTFDIYVYIHGGGVTAGAQAVVTADPYYTYVDDVSASQNGPGSKYQVHYLDAGNYVLLGAWGSGPSNPLALWYSSASASW